MARRSTAEHRDFLRFKRRAGGGSLPRPVKQPFIFAEVVFARHGVVKARRQDSGETVRVVTGDYGSLRDIAVGDEVSLARVNNVWHAVPVMARVAHNSDGSRSFYGSTKAGERLLGRNSD